MTDQYSIRVAGGERPEGTQGKAEGGEALQERECGEATVETGDPQGGALATWKPTWQLRSAREGLELSGMERASVLPHMADRRTVMHTSE